MIQLNFTFLFVFNVHEFRVCENIIFVLVNMMDKA